MVRVKGGDDSYEVRLIGDRLAVEEDIVPGLPNSGPAKEEEINGSVGDRRPGGWG